MGIRLDDGPGKTFSVVIIFLVLYVFCRSFPDSSTCSLHFPCDETGFPGARISPHYDSLLVKITAKARTRREGMCAID
jgi:hypothetical protein